MAARVVRRFQQIYFLGAVRDDVIAVECLRELRDRHFSPLSVLEALRWYSDWVYVSFAHLREIYRAKYASVVEKLSILPRPDVWGLLGDIEGMAAENRGRYFDFG
jgi:hypothetical protein